MSLSEKLANLPTQPGCYIYRDEQNKILYVGKAKNLRNRVRQYFQSSRSHDAKTNELVSRIADFELIVTDNEIEALALECNLIKKHKPPFNVLLKDDKQYPHIKITAESAPRAIIARKLVRDGSRYYGPYLPPSLAWHTLDLVNRNFQLRTCTMEIDGGADRPCLEYHIKRCLGPCVKQLCTLDQYDEAVRDVELLLQGKTADLEADLKQRMERASDELRFEAAARYRDQLKTIDRLGEQQKMLTVSGEDIDIFGYYREDHQLALALFTMREGKVVGKREFFWEDITEPFAPGTFIGQALKQYYTAGDYAPGEVYVPDDFEDRELLEEYLFDSAGPKSSYHFSAERGQTRSDRSRGEECATKFRSAFSRTATRHAARFARATGCAGIDGRARAHRVVRHIEHTGLGKRRLDGRLRAWRDEEIRLSQV